MYKVQLEEIALQTRWQKQYEEWLAAAKKKEARGSAKAADEVLDYKARLADIEATLSALEAERAAGLAALETGNYEIDLATCWTDDYGRRDGGVNRVLYASYDEAMARYNTLKDRNGGYIKGWLEIRPKGEYQHMMKLLAHLGALKAELDVLTEGKF